MKKSKSNVCMNKFNNSNTLNSKRFPFPILKYLNKHFYNFISSTNNRYKYIIGNTIKIMTLVEDFHFKCEHTHYIMYDYGLTRLSHLGPALIKRTDEVHYEAFLMYGNYIRLNYDNNIKYKSDILDKIKELKSRLDILVNTHPEVCEKFPLLFNQLISPSSYNDNNIYSCECKDILPQIIIYVDSEIIYEYRFQPNINIRINYKICKKLCVYNIIEKHYYNYDCTYYETETYIIEFTNVDSHRKNKIITK